MAVEPIETGHDFRRDYLLALKSGREQFMMNVSGYSLERVREDRRLYLAGYNIFGKVELVEDAEAIKVPRRNKRKPIVPALAMGFADNMRLRMNRLGLNSVELAALTRLSQATICDVRNGHSAGAEYTRRMITEALDKYETVRAAFFKDAAE